MISDMFETYAYYFVCPPTDPVKSLETSSSPIYYNNKTE